MKLDNIDCPLHDKTCYILFSTPDDLLEIAARATTGVCREPPREVYTDIQFPNSEYPKYLTCSRNSMLRPKKGNYILWDWLGQNMELPNILTIAKIKDNYCVPILPACELEAMMDTIMNERIATGVTMKDYIDIIDVLLLGTWPGKATTTPLFVRCQGILGSAFDAGFTYVRMESENEACAAKIQMQSPTDYLDVCDGYVQNDCGFQTIIF